MRERLWTTWSSGTCKVEVTLSVGRWPKGGPKAVVGCPLMTWQELEEEKKWWLRGLAEENTRVPQN